MDAGDTPLSLSLSVRRDIRFRAISLGASQCSCLAAALLCQTGRTDHGHPSMRVHARISTAPFRWSSKSGILDFLHSC